MTLIRLILLFAFLLLAPAGPAAALSVAPSGPAEPVFVWQGMRCAQWDTPDAAAHAWRDVAGQVHLLAAYQVNRAMVGRDFDHLHRDCTILYQGGGRDEPERFDDRAWLVSPYTPDGNTVYALVHNEFQGHLRPLLCPSRDYIACWQNSLTSALSRDGGASFVRAATVAAPAPYRYGGDSGHRVGYFDPSNIIFRDGYYYAFFWAEGQGAQRRGACLMRTGNLADPAGWRAWDGQSFAVRFVNPYLARSDGGPLQLCAPVGEGRLVSFVSSVVRHRESGLYVALMATSKGESGIFSATSPDLIHWSEPTLVLAAGVPFKFNCADSRVLYYPALIDPASSTRNFEDIDDSGYLYVVLFNKNDCKIGPNRDIIRIPVVVRDP